MAKKGLEDSVPGHAIGPYVEEYLVKPYVDDDGVQVAAGIKADGKEYGDPVPMAPPVGYRMPPDLMTMIKQMVHSEELRRLADEEGFDSAEDADDFEIDDDPIDPETIYERWFKGKEEAALEKMKAEEDARSTAIAAAMEIAREEARKVLAEKKGASGAATQTPAPEPPKTDTKAQSST